MNQTIVFNAVCMNILIWGWQKCTQNMAINCIDNQSALLSSSIVIYFTCLFNAQFKALDPTDPPVLLLLIQLELQSFNDNVGWIESRIVWSN